MDISQNCIKLISHYEGRHASAYPDPASKLGKACTTSKLKVTDYKRLPNWQKIDGHPWTIGVGHTGLVNGTIIKAGLTITEQVIDQILKQDLKSFIKDVNSLVKVSVVQPQFDALVSFAFNLGSDIDADTIAEGLGDSTLLKYLNAKKFELVPPEFLKWNKAGGEVLGGLVCRRKSESVLFGTGRLQFYKWDSQKKQAIPV